MPLCKNSTFHSLMLLIHVENSTCNAKNSALTKQNKPVAMKTVCACCGVCVLLCLCACVCCACVCLCVCSGGWLLFCQPTNQTDSQGNSSTVLDLLFLHFVRLVWSQQRCFLGARSASLVQLLNLVCQKSSQIFTRVWFSGRTLLTLHNT